MFDQRPPVDKENSFRRANHFQDASLDVSRRSSKSGSTSTSVLVIKALQNKITVTSEELSTLRNDFQERIQRKNERIMELEMTVERQTVEIQNLQQSQLIQKQLLTNEYEPKMETLIENVKSLEDMLRRATMEIQLQTDKINKLQEENLFFEESVHLINQELKKERQSQLKLKQEYLNKLSENDQQYEQKIDYYQQTCAQLQGKLQSGESFKKERDQLLDRYKELQEINDRLKMEQDLLQQQRLQLEEEKEKLSMRLAQSERVAYETFAQKDQENQSLSQRVQQLSAEIMQIQRELKQERIKSDHLENQLEQILTTTQETNRSQTPVKLETSYRMSTSKSIQKSNTKQDYDLYQELLNQIVETEQKAYQLNEEYQYYLQGIQEGKQLKQELHNIVSQIKQTNSLLYDLKAREFQMFSQN